MKSRDTGEHQKEGAFWPQNCLDELKEDLETLTYDEQSVREIMNALQAVNTWKPEKEAPDGKA